MVFSQLCILNNVSLLALRSGPLSTNSWTLCQQIYAMVCVISQFQEYLEGRGTAAFDYSDRVRNIIKLSRIYTYQTSRNKNIKCALNECYEVPFNQIRTQYLHIICLYPDLWIPELYEYKNDFGYISFSVFKTRAVKLKYGHCHFCSTKIVKPKLWRKGRKHTIFKNYFYMSTTGLLIDDNDVIFLFHTKSCTLRT